VANLLSIPILLQMADRKQRLKNTNKG